MQRTGFFVVSAVVIGGLVAAAVFWPKQEGVTIYCATDDVIAQPVLDEFTRATGIPFRAVEFDTEQSKTVGLANRLKFEKDHPRCDVFWCNETLQAVRLSQAGVFEPYVSPSAADIPAEFKDKDGLWTGFAARPRILIVSTDPAMWQGDARPNSMDDLVDPKWKGRAVLAQPLAGTTLTHCVVLMSVLGKERAMKWLETVHADCLSPVGNGQAANAVGLRQAAFGFTDIDDFHAIERQKQPVDVVYPDQKPGQPGTLLIPNTVALIKGGPRPDLGRQLIDFLLSKKVEEMLAAGDAAQVPLRADVRRPAHVKVAPTDFRAMKVDWQDAASHYDERLDQLQALWGK